MVGEVNHGFQYISQALDLERFTMFTFSPIKQRLDLLIDYVKTATRDGEPLRDDPVIRQRIARLATDAEVARVLGLKVVAASMKGEKVPGTPPPTVESSKYKLFATEFSRRLANASMDIGGPGTQLRVRVNPDAPMEGRAESTYRYTVIDTIGGGASEIQKNIIARRGLGLPKNFYVLEGLTVLDLASVGPAARTSRWLADYGARVVKVGPPPKQSGVQIVPPFYAYSGHRGMERVLLDLKSDGGRAAFLRLAEKADVVIESFRPGVMARLGLGYDDVRAAESAHRLLLDERLRPDRPPLAMGRPRPQLPGGRWLPRLLGSRRERRARIAGRDDRRRRGRRDAGRHRDPRRARAAWRHERRRVPRRVGGRRCGGADVVVRRRVLRNR